MNKTKTLKKLLSVALVLVMALSTMVIMPLTANAACTQVTAKTPSGDGSAANPYLVGSHEEWAGLKALVEAEGNPLYKTKVYVKITADFDIGHSCPLDNTSYPSSVNSGSIMWQIDGQGHTIGNTTTQLILGTVGGVTIKNLTVEMASTNAEAYGAAFIGVVCADRNGEVLIENCVAKGTMNYSYGSTRTAGGFVGNVYYESPKLTVRNCVNDLTIYNSNAVAQRYGGILGGCEDNAIVVIENCVNNGTLTAKAGWVGGMLGKYTSATSVTITNCINNGELVNTNTYVGGMVGYQPKTANITISDCYSTGAVDMPVTGGTNVPVITNNKTLDEVRAMITMPRQDGTPLASLTAWDGTTKTLPVLASLADEDPENDEAANSAENPYLIGTADELAYLNGNAIGYCKLTDNINMGGQSWTGVTAGNHIDGDNYTIYNIWAMAYSAGFLKAGTLNANISNLHFSAMKVTGGSGAAGLAAYATGSAVLNISNVTIDANSIIGTDRAAGNTTAGIVGDEYGASTGKFTVDKFIMAAQITNTSSSKTQIGGLFGGFEAATNAGNIVVTNTIMEGTVNTVGSAALAGSLIGEGGAAYAWTNVYVLAGVTAAGVSGGESNGKLTPAISNCYSASFAASENFADEIGEINKMGLTGVEVTSTVGGKRATRLKVTDDFGFMAMADKSEVSLNPHATVGIVVLKGAVDAETLMAEGTFVEAEDYQAASGQVCAKYTDISVATMDEDYTYAFAVATNGMVVSVGTLYTINCYDWASQLAVDGTYEGTAVTNVETEIALYDAMVKYCDKYNAYLTYVNAQ